MTRGRAIILGADLVLSLAWVGYLIYLDVRFDKSGAVLIGGAKLWLAAQLFLLLVFLLSKLARRIHRSLRQRSAR